MEITQTGIECFQSTLDRFCTLTEESEAIVPDRMPDIRTVLCGFGSAVLQDVTVQKGRVLLSGSISATVLYYPETENTPKMLKIPFRFAHIEENERLNPDDTVCAEMQSVIIDASAVNSRKVKATAQIGIQMHCFWRQNIRFTESIPMDGVEIQRAEHTLSLLQHIQIEKFTVLDDLMLTDAENMELLQVSGSARMQECRTLPGKILMKGELQLSGLALQEDQTIRTVSGATPFTQIVAVEGVTEGASVQVLLSAETVDCRLDAGGMLSCTATIQAALMSRMERNISCITDWYLPGKSVSAEQGVVQVYNLSAPQPITAETVLTVPVSRPVSNLIYSAGVYCGHTAGENGVIMRIAVQTLYEDEEEGMRWYQRVLPVTLSDAKDWSNVRIQLIPKTKTGKELVFAVAVSGEYVDRTILTLPCFTSFAVEEKQQKGNVGTILLRHIEGPESLWSIAKQCGATVSAIREANGLREDSDLVEGRMLLIPVVCGGGNT